MAFFKEFWLWILVPFLLVVAGLLIFVFFMEDDSVSPFQYNVF